MEGNNKKLNVYVHQITKNNTPFFHPNKVIYIINGRGERFLYRSVNAHKKKKTLQLYEMAGKEWIQAMS